MDLIRPAFFSLKKICSRNSEETFSRVASDPIETGRLWLVFARLMTALSPYLPLVVILILAVLQYAYIIMNRGYYQLGERNS
jgi:hypothetical protein